MDEWKIITQAEHVTGCCIFCPSPTNGAQIPPVQVGTLGGLSPDNEIESATLGVDVGFPAI